MIEQAKKNRTVRKKENQTLHKTCGKVGRSISNLGGKSKQQLNQSKSQTIDSLKKTEALLLKSTPIGIRLLKKNKLIEEFGSDVSFSSEDSSKSELNSKPLVKPHLKIIATKQNKKNTNKGNIKLSTKTKNEALNEMKSKLTEVSQGFETAKTKSEELEGLLEDVAITYLSLSSSLNENSEILQPETIQKFHTLETDKNKIFKRFQAIQRMTKEFGEELEKTRKTLNSIPE